MDIVIVEDNKDMCNSMVNFFEKDTELNVIGVSNSGIEGLNLIIEKKPDIALIDIILPGKDGLAVLEELNSLGITKGQTDCIVLSAVSSDNITLKAFQLGAKYVMLKPCDLTTLSRRIKEFRSYKDEYAATIDMPIININKNESISMERRIASILNEIGIMPNLKGYKYLRMAIMMSLEDEVLLEGITKFLYPDIAKENRTTYTRVERAIRHALETAWDKGNGKIYYKILGYMDSNNGKRPTNSEFIASIVDYLKLNQK